MRWYSSRAAWATLWGARGSMASFSWLAAAPNRIKSPLGVSALTTPAAGIHPETGTAAASWPNTGASCDLEVSSSVLAKTRNQGPFFSTITISRPGEISARREEELSGATYRLVLRMTVALGPLLGAGGLGAAFPCAANIRMAENAMNPVRIVLRRFPPLEYADMKTAGHSTALPRLAGEVAPVLL